MVVLWRRLSPEQRVAGVAAVLLVISTFGPFSFVEAATVLAAGGVLALLRLRALGRRFHLPGGDGLVTVVAAGWSALLILARILDRPFGQSVLALGCCVILGAAGLRERMRRPSADVSRHDHDDVTRPMTPDDDGTVALPTEATRKLTSPPRPRPDGPPRPR